VRVIHGTFPLCMSCQVSSWKTVSLPVSLLSAMRWETLGWLFIVHAPIADHGAIKLEKVSHTPLIPSANGCLRNAVAAHSHPLGHPSDGQISARQPEVYQVDAITCLAKTALFRHAVRGRLQSWDLVVPSSSPLPLYSGGEGSRQHKPPQTITAPERSFPVSRGHWPHLGKPDAQPGQGETLVLPRYRKRPPTARGGSLAFVGDDP
jgi:hypothetical protein